MSTKYRWPRCLSPSHWWTWSHETIATWQSLRNVGQSKVLSLSIAVPIIGSLILFNSQVVSVLSVAPEVIWSLSSNISYSEEEIEKAARSAVLWRLYVLYFGFAATGIASFLFLIFCPPVIRRYPSAWAYLSAEQGVVTSLRVARISEFLDFELRRNPTDTIFRGQLENITRIHQNRVLSSYQDRLSEYPVEGVADRGRLDHVSRMMADETIVSVAVYAVKQNDSDLMEVVLGRLCEKPADVMEMEYYMHNRSRQKLQKTIIFLYGIGFLLLVSPTVFTFVKVAYSLVF